MKHLSRVWVLGLVISLGAAPLPAGEGRQILKWEELPSLPPPPGQATQLGVAGPFAGISNGALLVAGGANYPKGMPWQTLPDGTKPPKVWRDDVYVLLEDTQAEEGKAKYRWHTQTFKLSRKLAYGASVTTPHGVVCMGGCDEERCYPDVFLMTWDTDAKEVRFRELPSLPRPCAFAGAAVIEDTIYLVGGSESAEPEKSTKHFWSLKLPGRGTTDSAAWGKLKWKTDLLPLPGPPRTRPVVAAQNKGDRKLLYLISGKDVSPVEGPSPKRVEFLTDTWSFDPKAEQWTQLADVTDEHGKPRSVCAAPAAAYGPFHILVFGGHDGSQAGKLADHIGFSDEILAYHTVTDTWAKMGTTALPPVVTTVAVKWGASLIIPSGERKPGIRTPKVQRGRARPEETSFGLWNWAALIVYLLSLVAMGVYFSRREKTTEDFFLAGRRIPWWAAGLSIYGTQLSAITFMSIPATVFAISWRMYLAQWCIIAVAPLVAFVYLPFFRRLNVTTAYEYLEKRFNVPVRLFGSLSFIVFQLGRMAVVMLLPAIALSAVTGIDRYTCIILMGVLCTVYTVLGGIEAVIWTDVLQVVVLLGGAVLSLGIIAANVDGGLAGIFRVAARADKLTIAHWSTDYTMMAIWVVVLGNIFANLVPYTADQAVIQRYLTTKDEKAARGAIFTNAVLVIPGSLLFFSLGTALFVFYKANPQMLNPALQNNDAILPLFISQKLPIGIAGLVIAGVFAASMSSLDSSMNSVATAITTDFYRRFRPDAPDRTCLNLARGITVVLGILGTTAAVILATYTAPKDSLWFTFTKMLGLFGGGLAGIFALAIFTRRTNGVGALIGGIAGVGLTFLAKQHTAIHFYLWPAIAVVTCFVVGYVVSLIIPLRPKDLTGLTLLTQQKQESA